MAASESPIGRERRLHPFYLFWSFFETIRGFFIPIILVFVFSKGSFDRWALIFVLPGMIFALMRYLSLRYRLGETELHLRGGVIFRFERHIPYARIQNVKRVRNLFHRVLGLAGVTIETASGTEVEAKLDALDLESVREIERRIGRSDAPADLPDAGRRPPVYRLSLLDILLAGLASNRGIGIALGGFFLLWEISGEDSILALVERVSQVLGFLDLPEEITSGLGVVLLAPLGFVFVLVVVKLLSMIESLLRHGRFQIRIDGDDLQFRQGLFTEVASRVPRARIQSISIRRSWMHRLLGSLEIRFVTAGGSGVDESGVRKIPLVRVERLDEVLEILQPGANTLPRDWQRVDQRCWRRILVRSAIFWALVIGLAALLVHPYFIALVVPGAPVLLMFAKRRMRTMSIGLTDDAVVLTRGWPTFEVHRLRYSRIQSVTTQQSPFDRRWNMAGLTSDHAGGTFGESRVALSYLEREQADHLSAEIGRRAAAADFVWK